MQKIDSPRIYCVVAKTVQFPLGFHDCAETREWTNSPYRLDSTRNIVQPLGRQIAQACHAVSLAKFHMTQNLLNDHRPNVEGPDLSICEVIGPMCGPITTIILECRDSLELYHIWNLALHRNVPISAFYDTGQPDYGEPTAQVLTALATDAVPPNSVLGVLDYLPLWSA